MRRVLGFGGLAGFGYSVGCGRCRFGWMLVVLGL